MKWSGVAAARWNGCWGGGSIALWTMDYGLSDYGYWTSDDQVVGLGLGYESWEKYQYEHTVLVARLSPKIG